MNDCHLASDPSPQSEASCTNPPVHQYGVSVSSHADAFFFSAMTSPAGEKTGLSKTRDWLKIKNGELAGGEPRSLRDVSEEARLSQRRKRCGSVEVENETGGFRLAGEVPHPSIVRPPA